MIYAVTCIGSKEEHRRTRCWGYFFDIAKAEEAILGNYTDMFEEGYYDHAVIEEVPEGICVYCVVKQWFVADYSNSKDEPGVLSEPEVRRVDEPKWAKMTCNWALS